MNDIDALIELLAAFKRREVELALMRMKCRGEKEKRCN